MADADDARLLHAGRVGAAHGLDGSFHVTGPSPALLEQGTIVTIAGAERTIERRAGHDGAVILRLSGCTDRAALSALRGQDILVPLSSAPQLGDDEWWAADLQGCAVGDGDRAVGTVRRLLALPSCEVLEVERIGGGDDLLVPLVSDAVRSVDIAAKRIDVDLHFLGERSGD